LGWASAVLYVLEEFRDDLDFFDDSLCGPHAKVVFLE